MRRVLILATVAVFLGRANATEWVRAGLNTNQPVWGIRGHLLWALHPAGFRSNEPRGLIRLGYPVLSNGVYDLINFIAIEPVVAGKKGFSELEYSRLDKRRGKRIWAENSNNGAPSGVLTNLSADMQSLTVALRVERFENGAHVRLVARQRSDRPDELELITFQEPDSPPIEQCVLTSTMGNMARTRLLWLNDSMVSSLELFHGFRGDGFARTEFFPLSRLKRIENGDMLAAITTDEAAPWEIRPFPKSNFWHYRGRKVTQYWRIPSSHLDGSLHLAVNGRYTYWGSRRPIPGGVAFENFEIRRPFRDGQVFVFGITAKTPEELGFTRK